MPMASLAGTASADLGLGTMLDQQQQDETEEEKRRRRLGLSTLGMNPLNFGMTGIASADLGLGAMGAGRR